MAKVKLSVWGFRCERCRHEWVPRTGTPPRVCPKCKSPYWDKPKKTDAGLEQKFTKKGAASDSEA